MSALWIVQALDVVEDVGPGIVSRAVDLACRALGLQGREEALHCGVVPDIARAAHRAGDSVIGQQSLEGLARVLLGFKRWSQHRLCSSTGATRQAPLRAFSRRASFLVVR